MRGGQRLSGDGCLEPAKLWAARSCVPLLQAFCLVGSEQGPGGEVEEMKSPLKGNRSEFFLCIYKDKFSLSEICLTVSHLQHLMDMIQMTFPDSIF